MTGKSQFSIYDRALIPVQSFSSYRAAERAAIAWCREKKSHVPIYRGATRLADVRPCARRGHVIDMTAAGSEIA